MTPRIWSAVLLISWPLLASAEEVARLPDTAPLTWEGDLSEKMMDGLHRDVERPGSPSPSRKPRPCCGNAILPPRRLYAKSIEPNREYFRKVIGDVVDPRPGRAWNASAMTTIPPWWPRLSATGCIRSAGRYSTASGARVCCWSRKVRRSPTLSPFPTRTRRQNSACRSRSGRGEKAISSLAAWRRTAARSSCRALVDRLDRWSGNAGVAWTNQTHREWIYRQAYQMGRHLIGYEVQKILAAVDWFCCVAARRRRSLWPVMAKVGLLAS